MISVDYGTRGPGQHAMTTFVYASKAGGAAPPPPIAEIVNSSIDQWYAIDYRKLHKRKLTPVEWDFLRQLLAVWKRSERKAAKDLREGARLERVFNRGLAPRRTPKDIYARPVSARRHA